MKSRTWYESRLGGASRSYYTEREARAEIEQAAKGHPENSNMNDADREYWKKVAKDMLVVKMTQTEEVL